MSRDRGEVPLQNAIPVAALITIVIALVALGAPDVADHLDRIRLCPLGTAAT